MLSFSCSQSINCSSHMHSGEQILVPGHKSVRKKKRLCMILSQYSVRSVKLSAAYLFLLWRPDKFCKINLTVERKRNIINV